MNGKPKRSGTLRLLPRLVTQAMQVHPWGASGLAAMALAGSLLPAVELWLTGRIIDELAEVLGGGETAFLRVLPWVAGFFGTLVGYMLLDMARAVLQVDVQEKIAVRLQRQVIDKVQKVELVHFEHPEFYDALKRANEDMSDRLLNLLNVVLDVIGTVGGLGAILAVMLTGHWALGPLVVVGSVPGVWVMMRMNKKTHHIYRERTPKYRETAYYRQLMTGRPEATEVRLFTLRNHLLDTWRDKMISLARERRGLEAKQAWYGGATSTLDGWAYVACLAILAWMVAGAQLTIGQYGMLTRAVQQFAWRVGGIMRSLSSLHEESLYLGDLYEFFSLVAPEEPTGPADEGAVLENLPLRFDNVSFSYPGGEQVLKDIDMEIRPGERIALVGENGAGKTTLVKLMMGLYQPTAGQILLGDRPLGAWPQDRVRRLFAAVFQDFVRFQFPVRDNIAFGALGREGSGERVVMQAAELAGAAEFIEELPDQYGALLGKELGGADLSTGQWQKLATARALARAAEFVVLDEPTSALDPKAEAEVYRRFGEMTRGKASVMISHRLGSARPADRILVLKGGRLIEEGSHEALMRGDGEYSRLFRLQAQWYE